MKRAVGIRKRVGNFLIRRRLARKWDNDMRMLPLSEAHRDLYDRIHTTFFRNFGRFPDLINGQEYNERIQWLKLFDQNPLALRCSDKLGVREFSAQRIGPAHLLDVYQVGKTFADLNFNNLPRSFFIKTNCDSGTVIIVRDKAKMDIAAAQDKVTRSLNRRAYGWESGEWGYKYIPRRVFAEEMINSDGDGTPPDYKFHCCEGRVKFVHYLYDRSVGLKEQIITPDGNPTQLRLAGHRLMGNAFEKPPEWEELISIAEKLAAGFKYIRVDLYVWDGRIYVGEMTFWPHSGMYVGEGQKAMGTFLDFDRQTYLPLFCPTEDIHNEALVA